MTAALVSPVTATYRVRLAQALTRQSARIDTLWGQFDANAATDTLAAIGSAAGPVVAGGQAAFMAETLAYLRALIAQHARVALADVPPFTLPDGIAGIGASGAPVGALTGIAPRVYTQRRDSGWEHADAVSSARSWVDAVSVSEPYRAANATVVDNAMRDRRLSGRIWRVPESDACDFCQLISDRGYSPAHAGFQAHAFCRCTAEPEIDDDVPFDDAGVD